MESGHLSKLTIILMRSDEFECKGLVDYWHSFIKGGAREGSLDHQLIAKPLPNVPHSPWYAILL